MLALVQGEGEKFVVVACRRTLVQQFADATADGGFRMEPGTFEETEGGVATGQEFFADGGLYRRIIVGEQSQQGDELRLGERR